MLKGNTISINHNWGNEHNVKAMWAQLREDHRLVQQGIYYCTQGLLNKYSSFPLPSYRG